MQTSLVALLAGADGYGGRPHWPPRDFVEEERQRLARRFQMSVFAKHWWRQ